MSLGKLSLEFTARSQFFEINYIFTKNIIGGRRGGLVVERRTPVRVTGLGFDPQSGRRVVSLRKVNSSPKKN